MESVSVLLESNFNVTVQLVNTTACYEYDPKSPFSFALDWDHYRKTEFMSAYGIE